MLSVLDAAPLLTFLVSFFSPFITPSSYMDRVACDLARMVIDCWLVYIAKLSRDSERIGCCTQAIFHVGSDPRALSPFVSAAVYRGVVKDFPL